MRKSKSALQSRSRLDLRLREIGPVSRYKTPLRGWIRAIREALGMSTKQLAHRLEGSMPFELDAASATSMFCENPRLDFRAPFIRRV